MDLNDFQGEKRMKYFSNAFSFTNKSLGTIESLKNKYLGMTVYPKKMLPAKRIVSFEDKQTESRVHLPRYTVLQIKEIKLSPPGSLATLSLTDRDGAIYELETDLKYDVIVKMIIISRTFSDSRIYIKNIRALQKAVGRLSPGEIWRQG